MSQCPVEYWDKPSKSCANDIINLLQKLGDSFSPVNINRTCVSWEKMRICYEELIGDCRVDSEAVSVLKSHMERFRIYSLPCRQTDPNQLLHNSPLMECFLAYFTPTQTCTEAFDKFFRNFVIEKQYGNACRAISSSLKCFVMLQNKIGDKCGSNGADEYHRGYIVPLVDQSRETVNARCTLAPPYGDFYKSIASQSTLHFHGDQKSAWAWLAVATTTAVLRLIVMNRADGL